MTLLTYWGRVTHICVGNLTFIGSDNGLSPGRRQAIIWTSAGILLIGPLGTNFSEILIGIQTFSFTKMHLKMSSAKLRPFCRGLSVLKCLPHLPEANKLTKWWTIEMWVEANDIQSILPARLNANFLFIQICSIPHAELSIHPANYNLVDRLLARSCLKGGYLLIKQNILTISKHITWFVISMFGLCVKSRRMPRTMSPFYNILSQ